MSSVMGVMAALVVSAAGSHTGTVMSPEGEPQSQSTPFRAWMGSMWMRRA
jgi:hypothetical protein